MTGRMLAANRSASLTCAQRPSAAAWPGFERFPSLAPWALRADSAAPRALANHPALLLRQSGVEVEHEGVGVGPELGDDEGDALRHEAGDEGHVAGEPIELGDQHRAIGAPCRGQGGGKLRSPVECIRSLAGFHLDELAQQRDPLPFGEAGNGGALGLDAEP